jgi:hypothetical protein
LEYYFTSFFSCEIFHKTKGKEAEEKDVLSALLFFFADLTNCRMTLVLAVFLLLHIVQAVKVSISTADRRILVDGKPFFFKGINYKPTPIGYDWKFDLFNDRRIIERDIENLKYLGVNSVRIHRLEFSNLTEKIYLLDKLYENGIYAVLCRVYDRTLNYSDSSVRKNVLNEWGQFVSAFKDHPAVVMWMFGNEMNNPSKWNVPAVFSLLGEITNLTHEIEGIDNWHPVSTPLLDGSIVQTIKIYDNNVDVWSYQVYRGSSFFSIIGQAADATKKPLLITEYGVDSYDSIKMREDQDLHANFVSKLYLEISNNAKINKLSGGFIFKYSDD